MLSFFQAEDGIRDTSVTGVQTCALPIYGGATNVSNTFASALWGLDFMYWWAAHGAAGVNFHTGDKVAAGSELRPSKYTPYFTSTNGYLVRPLGYGIKAFDLGSHGKLIPVTISNPGNLNLTAYAVLGDDKNLYL